MTGTLDVDIDVSGIATLTLARPEKGNAYDYAMLGALHAALERLQASEEVRAVVLRGSGKHFCVGADVTAIRPGQPSDGPGLVDVCEKLDTFAKPVIARVHGACLGGGLVFASCCDVAIAHPQTFFSLPEVRLGFSPSPIIPYLHNALPYRVLRRVLLSGERFGAAKAAEWGLVHEVVDEDAMDARLNEILHEFLHAAPGAVGRTKRMLRRVHGAVAADVIETLKADIAEGTLSEEAAEGRAAFREKRPPRWAPKRQG